MASAVVLATAGYDHKIRFWEASREKCTRVLRFPDSQVNALAITNDKHYIAAVGNTNANIFEVQHGEGNPVRTYEAHAGNVTAVGFQVDVKWMYTGGEDKTVKIWDLRAPRWQRQYECPAAVNSVALHPNQMELVSGDQAGNVRVWDLQKNAFVQELRPGDYDYGPDPVEFGSEAHLASGGGSGGAASSSSFSGKHQAAQPPVVPSGASTAGGAGPQSLGSSVVPRHGGDAGSAAIRSVSLASDGSCLCAGNHGGRVFTWVPSSSTAAAASTESATESATPAATVQGVKGSKPGVSPGGQRAAYVRRCVTDTGHKSYFIKCVISPDVGKLVTCSADKTCRVWSLAPALAAKKPSQQHPPSPSPAPPTPPPPPPPPPGAHQAPQAPSSSGNDGSSSVQALSGPLFASSSANLVWAAQQENGARGGGQGLVLEKTLAQHQRWVWDACFSADSAYLVTASSDFTARLWDVASGEVIRHYKSPMAITCVALNDASG